jgi:hypothetical protein
MATSLNIDPELLEEAIALDQESSAEAIVHLQSPYVQSTIVNPGTSLKSR